MSYNGKDIMGNREKGGFVIKWTDKEGNLHFGQAFNQDQSDDLIKQKKFIVKHIIGPMNPKPLMEEGKRKQSIVNGDITTVIGFID